MNERTELAPWETWPIWALGLSNGLNLAIWYVVSMLAIQAPGLTLTLPLFVNAMLPLLIVGGAVATAVSLDGVLVATLAGMRQGRRGGWSWATITGAGLFSGAIAWAVHSGQSDALPGLHVAQAVVLVLYNLHLSQPKRLDTEGATPAGTVYKELNSPDDTDLALEGFTCSRCGADGFRSTTDIKRHQKAGCVNRAVTTATQRIGAGSTDGVNPSEV